MALNSLCKEMFFSEPHGKPTFRGESTSNSEWGQTSINKWRIKYWQKKMLRKCISGGSG